MPRHYSLYLHICVFHSPNPPLFFLTLKKIVNFLILFFHYYHYYDYYSMISSFLYYLSSLKTIQK